MPELPEVEHAMQRLAAVATGKRVAALRALHPALGRGLPASDLEAVVGRRIELVERRGKHQLVHLSGDVVIVAHFRMAGDWHDGVPHEPPRFARAALEFTDGSAVFLVDSRAFATLVVRPRGGEQLPALGIDAASPALDGGALARAVASRRGPLKPVLLDQSVIAGLGNIYAAEALWHAALSPFSPTPSLGEGELERLAVAIRHTMARAFDDPGRYSRGEGLARLAVYGRGGESCLRCGTPIVRVPQAGRSTFYCPGCQALPSDAGVSRAPPEAPP